MTNLILATGNTETWQMIEHVSFGATILAALIAWLTFSRKKERRQIEPNPLRVRKVSEKATEENCKERYHQLSEAIETVARQNDDEHKRLYDQIDTVERRGEDNLKASMKEINETFRRLPNEMLELLKNTGQLRDHHSRTDK